VVPDFSSQVGYALEVKESIDANHMEMVQFGSNSSSGFKDVSGVLKGYCQEISKTKSNNGV